MLIDGGGRGGCCSRASAAAASYCSRVDKHLGSGGGVVGRLLRFVRCRAVLHQLVITKRRRDRRCDARSIAAAASPVCEGRSNAGGGCSWAGLARHTVDLS